MANSSPEDMESIITPIAPFPEKQIGMVAKIELAPQTMTHDKLDRIYHVASRLKGATKVPARKLDGMLMRVCDGERRGRVNVCSSSLLSCVLSYIAQLQ